MQLALIRSKIRKVRRDEGGGRVLCRKGTKRSQKRFLFSKNSSPSAFVPDDWSAVRLVSFYEQVGFKNSTGESRVIHMGKGGLKIVVRVSFCSCKVLCTSCHLRDLRERWLS